VKIQKDAKVPLTLKWTISSQVPKDFIDKDKGTGMQFREQMLVGDLDFSRLLKVCSSDY
jgi:hypothetical protein